MATLAVGDLVIPQMLLDYVLAQTTYRSAFVGSGAAMVEPIQIAGAGGNTWTARDLAPYSSRPVAADGTTATAVKHTARAYISPVFRRRFYFNMNEEIKAALGEQNAARLQALIQADQANLWPKEFDLAFIDICKAAFDTSSGVLRSTNSYSSIAASATAADVPFTMGGYVAAKAKLGDAADQLQALVVHSKVWGDIESAESQRITFQAITGPDGAFIEQAKYYNGKRVIVSDNVPTATSASHTVYSSYLVGLGVFALGIQKGQEVSSGKLLASGINELLYEMSFGTGCVGLNWTGSPSSADSGATAAEIATATNWTKVGATKEVRIVEYRSN